MDRTAPPSAADSKPFVRARRIELEPVLFAACMIAMVVVVGLWQPFSKSEQTLVAEQTTQAVGTKPAN